MEGSVMKKKVSRAILGIKMNVVIPIEESGYDFNEAMNRIASQRLWDEHSSGGDLHGLYTFPEGFEGNVLLSLLESFNLSSENSLESALMTIKEAMEADKQVKKFVLAIISGAKIYDYMLNDNLRVGDERRNTGNFISSLFSEPAMLTTV